MQSSRMFLTLLVACLSATGVAYAQPVTPSQGVVGTIPRMPTVPDPSNLYSETRAGQFAPHVAGHAHRIYVPSRSSNLLLVLDPATGTVLESLRTPARPRFVAPSWDLKTLWIVAKTEGRPDGSVIPLDPKTGKLGTPIPVESPHNLYWSADGRHAIIVARDLKRLDFRDANTMALEYSIPTPDCEGISHGEISISGRYAAFTCEMGAAVTKIDLLARKVVATTKVSRDFRGAQHSASAPEAAQAAAPHSMPQDMRISPDGLRLYVSDLTAGGLHVLDFASFRQVGFIPTGAGAHGLYPSRDGRACTSRIEAAAATTRGGDPQAVSR
jgi:DNA-binding beta-propeller fold protein YncE